MNHSRNKTTNPLRLSSVLTVLVFITFLCIAGIMYVYGKNVIHSVGGQKLKVENELKQLREESVVLQAQINQLSSRAALEKQLASGFITMQPILDERLVRVPVRSGGSPQDDFHAVSATFGF